MAAVSVSEVRPEYSVGFSHPVAFHVLSSPFPLQYRPCINLSLCPALHATNPWYSDLSPAYVVGIACSAWLA